VPEDDLETGMGIEHAAQDDRGGGKIYLCGVKSTWRNRK
jgi:hypothetical protein